MYTSSGGLGMRRLVAIAGIAAAMGVFACGSGDEAKNQSAGAAAAPRAVDSSRGTASVQATLAEPPKLPTKIGVITPEDFAKAVNGVAWTGHVVPRQCRGALGCRDTPGLTSTLVLHEAAAGANLQKFGPALGDAGVVISRMRNLGNHKERLFNLPKGPWDWYLVLTRLPSDAEAKGQLVKLEYDDRGKPTLETMPDTLRIVKCPDNDPAPNPNSDAGFKECFGMVHPASTTVLPNSFNRGAWFTCSLGCCTTDGVRGGTEERNRDTSRADSTARDSAGKQ